MDDKDLINEEYLLELLEEYNKVDKNSKDGINFRNAILEILLPKIHIVAKKYRKSVSEKDLVQDMVENALIKNIPQWVPGRKSTLGYFSKCFRNHCLNMCESESLYRERFMLIDSKEDSHFWDKLANKSTLVMYPIEDNRFEGVEQEAYEYCLEVIASDGIVNLYKDIRNDIVSRFGLRYGVAENILGNAVITVRESILDKRDTTNPTYDKNTLFGRMAGYLTEEQIGKILIVFAGLQIRVPKKGE